MTLQESLLKVNQEYFNSNSLPDIVLSKGQDKISRKAIIFGTYHTKKNIIKIHPVLLKSHVPQYVLEFVIYHELLHYFDRDLLLNRKKGDKVHTKDFKAREQQFKQYTQAQAFLKKILYGNDMPQNSNTNTDELLEIKSTKNQKNVKLRGEALEQALAESLQRLDHVLIKYNLIDASSKGGKRGTKKKNESVELDSNN